MRERTPATGLRHSRDAMEVKTGTNSQLAVVTQLARPKIECLIVSSCSAKESWTGCPIRRKHYHYYCNRIFTRLIASDLLPFISHFVGSDANINVLHELCCQARIDSEPAWLKVNAVEQAVELALDSLQVQRINTELYRKFSFYLPSAKALR